MGSKFDKLKRIFSRDDKPVPPELSWEKMEEGIRLKMDELKDEQSSGRIGKNRSFFWIGLLLILLMIPFVCVQINNDRGIHEKAQEPEYKSVGDIAVSEVDRDQGTMRTEADQPTPAHIDLQESGTDTSSIAHNRNSFTISSSRTPTKQKTSKEDLQNHTHIKVEKEPKEEALELRSGTPSRKPNRPLKQEALSKNVRTNTDHASDNVEGRPQPGESISIPRMATTAQPIASISPDFKPLFKREGRRSESLPTVHSKEPWPGDRTQGQQSTHWLSATSGISAWQFGFGSVLPERAPYEDAILSYNANLQYFRTSRKKLTLMVGIQYLQLENRLEWATTIENYPITLTDTIVQVQINSLTGQRKEVRGDIVLNVPATRRVRHYNTTRILQIPIAAGRSWTFGNFQSDILLGATVNIYSLNKGRTLDAGDIVSYESAEREIMSGQWRISGSATARLTYKFNSMFGLSASLQYQKSLTNWSKQPETKMHPGILNGSVGIDFYLK